jgi:hypothetical protein
MNLLFTAKMSGPAQTLVSPIKELSSRGHDVTVYATGNESEARGFQDIAYRRISPDSIDYRDLLSDIDVLVTGMSGFQSPDGYFVRAANEQGIPCISVADQDTTYVERLGKETQNLPTIIAVMNENCKITMESSLPVSNRADALARTKVVGWSAFDRYAEIKNGFTSQNKSDLLDKLSLEGPIYVHFTQNIHPQTDYMVRVVRSEQEKQQRFDYEMKSTAVLFSAALNLGIKLVVKPHPGEKFRTNYTKNLVDQHRFIYLPASACSTQELMLVADSVTSGKSTCLAEAALLDKNTGGIVPDIDDLTPYPSLAVGAIPYAGTWDGIVGVLEQVTSTDTRVLQKLVEKRKNFSVDGKASKRLADLVESLI